MGRNIVCPHVGDEFGEALAEVQVLTHFNAVPGRLRS
jgi:hypothetical protein